MPNLIGCIPPAPPCLSCYKTTLEGIVGNLNPLLPLALPIFPLAPNENDVHIGVFENGVGYFSFIGGVWTLQTYALKQDILSDWNVNVINKPACFTPCAHTHQPSEIVGYNNVVGALQNDLAQLIQDVADIGSQPITWAAVANKPACFTPCAHTHAIAEVTGLDLAISNLNVIILGNTNEIIAIQSALASHTHVIGNITGLQAALDARALTTHTHVIANVTGLQAALNDKQATLVSGTNIRTVKGQTLLGSTDIPIGELITPALPVVNVLAGAGGYTSLTTHTLPSIGSYLVMVSVRSGGAGVAPPILLGLNLALITKEGPVAVTADTSPTATTKFGTHTFFVKVEAADSLNLEIVATQAPTLEHFKIVKL